MSSSPSPPRKIKRLQIHANHSKDKQTQNISNTNLNNLYQKLNEINEATINIENNMKAQMNALQGQITFVAEALAENKILITKCLRQSREDDSLSELFPIDSEENLIQLENIINSDNRKQYIKAMRCLLEPSGVEKNLRRILSDNVIMGYNVDGVQGKKSLKEHKQFFSILLEAVSTTKSNSLGPADEHIRKALQINKRRILKNMSLQKKQ